MDPDMELYLYQEAATLRDHGWTVTAPVIETDQFWPSYCLGVDTEGCPVRTPNVRCRFCNKTRRLRREERGWSKGGPVKAA